MSSDNIKVSIKIRPLITREKNENCSKEWLIDENGCLASVNRGHIFKFDHIFDEDSTNADVFEVVAKPIVENALNGINGTIFAYGQTSSGKTYCLSGGQNDPGIVSLVVNEIFKQINRSEMENREFLIRVGYIEIYNEKIYDLLDTTKTPIEKMFENQGEVKISQIEVMASSSDVMLEHFQRGNESKRTGETAMNERSSRSHSIFSITIESREKGSSGCECKVSTLNLVDLAGSERADQTKATGERLNESKHINQSLLALGKVIRELSSGTGDNGDKFISYRDSKLTRLLSASLGGNAKTAIICTITPATIDETLSTLNFANNAKTIKNKPKVNNIISERTMIARLKNEILKLHNQLQEEKTKNSKLENINKIKHSIDERERQIIHGHFSNSNKLNEINRRRTWMCPSTNEDSADDLQDKPKTLFSTPPVQLPPPPFILRNTEDGPQITFSFDSENLDELFKPADEVDFDEPLPSLQMTDEELARRIRTPKLFKKKVQLPESPEIKSTSEMTKDEEIENLKQINEYLKNELQELQDFKMLENLCHNEMTSQTTFDKLNQQNETIAALNDSLDKKNSELKDLEVRIQLSENEQKKAVKERQEKENILASIQYEYEQFKRKSKLREDELVKELNEARSGNILKEFEAVSDQLMDSLQDNEKLQKELDDISELLSGKVLKIQELQEKIDQNEKIDSEYKKLKDILNSNQEIIQADDNDDLSEMIVKLIDAAGKTESLEVEKLQFIKEIKEIRCTAHALEESVEQISKKCVILEEEIQRKTAIIEKLEQEKIKLFNDLENTTAEKTSISSELEKMEKNITCTNEAQAQIDQLKTSLDDRVLEFEKFESEYQRLKKENDDLMKNLKDLLQDNQKLSQDINTINEAFNEKNCQIQELQEKIVQNEEINCQYMKTKEILKNIHEIIQVEDSDDLSEMIVRMKEATVKTESLEVENSQLIKNIEEIRCTAKEFEESAEQISKKCIILEEEIQRKSAIIETFEQEKMKIVDDLESTVAQKIDMSSELEKMEKNITCTNEAQAQIDQLKTSLEDRVLEFENLESEYQRLKKENDDLTKNLKDLLQDNQKLSQDINTINEAFNEKNCKIQELQEKIDQNEEIDFEYKKTKEILKSIHEIIQAEDSDDLSEMIVKIKNAADKTESLEVEKLQLFEKIEEIRCTAQESAEQINKKCVILEEEIQRKSGIIQTLEQENVKLLNDLESITTQKASLSSELEKMEKNLSCTNEAQAQIDQLKITLDDRVLEFEKLESEYQRLKIENDDLTKNLKDLLQENQKLSQDINTINEAFNEKNCKIQELQEKIDQNEKIDSEYEKLKDILNNNQEIVQAEENDDLSEIIIKLIDAAGKAESLEVEKLQLIEEIEEIRCTAQTFEESAAQINQLKTTLDDRVLELKNLESEYQRLKIENDDLTKNLKDLLQENQKLSQDINTINEAFNEKNCHIQELQEKIVQNEEINCQYMKTKEILKNIQEIVQADDNDDLSEMIVKMIDAAVKTESLEEEKLQLIKNIEEIRCTAKEFEKSAEQNNKKCIILEEEIQSKSAIIETLEKEKMKLFNDLENTTAEKTSISSELENIKKNISCTNELRVQINKLKTTLENRTREVKNLESEYQRLKKENDDLTKNLKIANESLAQQTSENFNNTQTILDLHRKNKELSSELQEYKNSPKKVVSPLQNRRSGDNLENEAYALQRKQLQIESNHGTPVRTMKSNQDRKTRRQSVYDENRRLSLWELTTSVETQTDNVNDICACKENAERIKELEIENLRKQVIINNAERMAKCNPLKIDLADIKMKYERELSNSKKLKSSIESLEEELSKYKSQQQLLSSQNLNQNSQYVPKTEFNKLMNEKISLEKKLNDVKRQRANSSEKENVGVNTSFNNIQSNDEIDSLKEAHNTLLRKYDMAKRLCNLRIDDLNILRKELTTKNDEIAAKDQEITRMTNKYQEAKRICILRMETIKTLRERLGEEPWTPSNPPESISHESDIAGMTQN